jgi:hypothetical protein
MGSAKGMTMTPIDLSMRATDLWLRAASLSLKAAVLPLELLSRAGTAAVEEEAAPSPKQRRRAARGEPTRGEATRHLTELRAAETEAAQPTDTLPPVGADVHVADDEPWKAYSMMSAADVLSRLEDADEATRAAVRLYELAHENRAVVLDATEG